MFKKIILLSLISLLALSACTLTVTVPATKTGNTEEVRISEENLDASPAVVEIEMGGGEFNLTSGGDRLLEGTVRYNVEEWKPEVTRSQSSLRISQGEQRLAVPNFDVVNEWNLTLGSQPVELKINAGAYKGELDFGGAALTRLEINDGASDSTLDFSQPNQSELAELSYATGASSVTVLNLSNARARKITFASGAGSYELAFGGDLKLDTSIQISSGASEVRLKLTENANIRVKFTGGISNIDPKGSWSINNGVYSHDGGGPSLEIEIDMVVGSVVLERE